MDDEGPSIELTLWHVAGLAFLFVINVVAMMAWSRYQLLSWLTVPAWSALAIMCERAYRQGLGTVGTVVLGLLIAICGFLLAAECFFQVVVALWRGDFGG